MLKQIIKRDGTIEDFIPHKLNKWGQWASENLTNRVDWSSVVLDAVKGCPDCISSQDLQKRLIKSCIQKRDWPHNLMAGRLYAIVIRKELYGDNIPTIYELQNKLYDIGLMRELKYSKSEYEQIERFIDHSRDLTYAHYQIHQIYSKYSIQDRVKNIKYETPQFTFIRMAMDLAEDEPIESRLTHIQKWYDHFSFGRINAPTPNYVNLGTYHKGYSSCCLYTVNDTAQSLAIGDHIAYTMTYMSSGIGSHLNTRSLGDPVRNGAFEHQGKLPYYKALAGAVKANLQAGRGGACTTYYSCYDPEAEVIALLQNPRTPKDKQNREIHFAVQFNKFFAKQVINNNDIFVFNKYTAPDLMQAFFSGDEELFEQLYNEYLIDPSFEKKFVSARKRLIVFAQQSYDVGTHYYAFMDEINRHTAFKEPIYSSNLCLEITEPTKPYHNMIDLYNPYQTETSGEVALCNLAAINVVSIPDNDDELYADAMYYALKMVDKTIHKAYYELPHIGYTAKQRLNAGIGMIGIAYDLAKIKLNYTSQEGRNRIHWLSERHMYHAISQSLRLGKELGNAPWIHKTKWVEGWLPIDTYKKSVDELVTVGLTYDWENLRQAIIKNKGIRNSCLVAHMPTESSSKASSVPNGIYPIRDLHLKKSDVNNIIDWCAPDSDLLKDYYQIAWNIKSIDLIKSYAIIQKFTDQAISADLYQDRRTEIDVTTEQLIGEFLTMVKYGLKTRYYQNSLTTKIDTTQEQDNTCVDGVCKL